MKDIKELVIDRARWGFGTGRGTLYDSSTNKMCCLGFLARACGSKVYDILDASFPVDGQAPRAFTAGTDDGIGSPSAITAVNINDASNLHLTAREKRIKTLFANHGIKVKFVGRVTKS
jgi:hypothetical protein